MCKEMRAKLQETGAGVKWRGHRVCVCIWYISMDMSVFMNIHIYIYIYKGFGL